VETTDCSSAGTIVGSGRGGAQGSAAGGANIVFLSSRRFAIMRVPKSSSEYQFQAAVERLESRRRNQQFASLFRAPNIISVSLILLCKS